ncbi:hypothetical protein [Nostoc sp. FACHB-110]|nr:hypothetical protein [Nostoc sp. FACHB-110]
MLTAENFSGLRKKVSTRVNSLAGNSKVLLSTFTLGDRQSKIR